MWGIDNLDEAYKSKMIKSSIMDMWLLSRCKTLFYQGNSSFSRISHLLHSNKNACHDWESLKTFVFLLLLSTYGYGETFIESEITYLAQSFKNIYLFPLCIKDNLRKLPDNVGRFFKIPFLKERKFTAHY